MKKILLMVLFMASAFLLAACNEDTKDTFIVTYTIDGVETSRQEYKLNDFVILPSEPQVEGKVFEYWIDNNQRFKEDTPVTKNINLVAKFKNKDVAGDYYSSVLDKEGTVLRNALKTRLYDGAKITSYQSSNWKTLKRADLIAPNSDNVWLIYDGAVRSVNLSGGQQGQWNKEHVVAKSWIEKIGANNNTGDQHNLRAADVKTNSDRGNKRFTDGTGSFKNNSNSYYPGDEHKGDVARIIMYMMVMLPELNINQIFESSNGFDILLKWHKEDAVDAFEIRRNNVIFEDQGNRNPFIDHPEFAALIFG